MQRQFEGGIYRDLHARAYAASIMSLFVLNNVQVHMYIVIDS